MRTRTKGAESSEKVIQQRLERPPVAQPAQRRSRLGPHLVIGVVQTADQGGNSGLGSDFTQYVGGPGASGMPIRIVEQSKQRLDDDVAMTGQDVGNAGREPGFGVGQCEDQRIHRARIGYAGQRSQRDLPHVGVFRLRRLNRLQQHGHRLGAADPSQ